MKLKDYLESNEISFRDFALENGFCYQSVYNWVLFEVTPHRFYQKVIEEATQGHVTNKDWPKAKPRYGKKIKETNNEKAVDRRKGSSKKNELHDTKCVRPNKASSSKVRASSK